MDFEFGEVTDISVVPENFRPLYKEVGEGAYNVDEPYRGVAEAVIGLNRSLKAARMDAKASKPVDLSALQDFGESPEEIRSAFESKIKSFQDELAKGEDAKLNLDKVREEMTSAHLKELEKRDAREKALQNQLYQHLVENQATAAVAEAKGIPELLMPFIKNQVKVVEESGQFNVYVVDPSGDRRYSGATGREMTIKELVSEMKANEKFGRLFEAQQAQGGGFNPASTRRPANTGKNLSSVDKISMGLKGMKK